MNNSTVETMQILSSDEIDNVSGGILPVILFAWGMAAGASAVSIGMYWASK